MYLGVLGLIFLFPSSFLFAFLESASISLLATGGSQVVFTFPVNCLIKLLLLLLNINKLGNVEKDIYTNEFEHIKYI